MLIIVQYHAIVHLTVPAVVSCQLQGGFLRMMWRCPRWCTADSNPIEVFNEAEKLASLRHPCVMAFYGIVTNPGSCATVAEYICHGSLRSGLQKIKKKVRQQPEEGSVTCCSGFAPGWA
jgi:serine/threonine protein kinase